MTTQPASLPPSYFDAIYANDTDPWDFAGSDYERQKYDATLAALPRPSFRCAFEIGCSIGVLTRRLARRCENMLAIDVAEAALKQARNRCAGLDHVAIQRMQIPTEWPDGLFDLILFSEVLYYLAPADIATVAERVRGSLAPKGTVVLVHYTLPTDYPCSGDLASDLFIDAAQLPVSQQQRQAQYRLDVLGN